MTNPIPAAKQIQAALRRIRSNADVMSERVRGDVSRRVAQQISSDADAGLAALHELVTGLASAEPAPVAERAETPANAPQPAPTKEGVVLALIQELCRLLESLMDPKPKRDPYGGRDVIAAALSVAQTVAAHVGVNASAGAPSTVAASPFSPAENPGAPGLVPDAPTLPDAEDVEEAADPPDWSAGLPMLVDDELLDAIDAAVALSEKRDTIVGGLKYIDRKAQQCETLFEQIRTMGWREIQFARELADIGSDITTDIRDEVTALQQALESRGQEANHG